jgi:hypothetical protein
VPVNLPPGEAFNPLLLGPENDITSFMLPYLAGSSRFDQRWAEIMAARPVAQINAFIYPFSKEDFGFFWNPTRRISRGREGDVYYFQRYGVLRWTNYKLLDQRKIDIPIPVFTNPATPRIDLQQACVICSEAVEGTEAFVFHRDTDPSNLFAVKKNEFILSPVNVTTRQQADILLSVVALSLILSAPEGKIFELMAAMNIPNNLLSQMAFETMLINKNELPQTVKIK